MQNQPIKSASPIDDVLRLGVRALTLLERLGEPDRASREGAVVRWYYNAQCVVLDRGRVIAVMNG